MILKQLMAWALAGHHGTVNLLLLLQWLQQQREAGFGQVCIACCSFCFPGAVAGEKSKGENWQVSLARWSLAGYQSCLAAGSQEQRGLSSHAGVHPSGLERTQLWVPCQPWAGASPPSLLAPLPWVGRARNSRAGSSSQHCLALPRILARAEALGSPSPVFGGFAGVLQLFSSAERAFV